MLVYTDGYQYGEVVDYVDMVGDGGIQFYDFPPAPLSGYYAMAFSTYQIDDGNVWLSQFVNFQFTIRDPNPTNRIKESQLTLQDINTVSSSVEDMRMMANSLLYKNTTAELYKGGRIVGAQFPAGASFNSIINEGFDDVLKQASLIGDTALELSTGCYYDWKISENSDYLYLDDFLNENDVLWEMTFPIRPTGAVVCIAADPGGQNSTYQSGQWIVGANVEFRTSSIWFDTQTIPTDTEALEAALNLNRQSPGQHENPLHIPGVLKEIWNGVKSFGEGVYNGVKTAAGVAEKIAGFGEKMAPIGEALLAL